MRIEREQQELEVARAAAAKKEEEELKQKQKEEEERNAQEALRVSIYKRCPPRLNSQCDKFVIF